MTSPFAIVEGARKKHSGEIADAQKQLRRLRSDGAPAEAIASQDAAVKARIKALNDLMANFNAQVKDAKAPAR